jgi:hypothetical protein
MRLNLARVPNPRGPLGQKPEKPPRQTRKGIRPVSPKRAAKKAQESASGAREHMAMVARIPCLVCGAWPVELHHEGKPRSDWNVLPLCPAHHRREYGPGAYHYSARAFYAAHGSSAELLAKVAQLVSGQ